MIERNNMSEKNGNKDSQLDNCYQKMFRFMIEQGFKLEWQIIAATMIAISLSLYKTVLDPQGYDEMMESIKESMDKIEPYEDKTLH